MTKNWKKSMMFRGWMFAICMSASLWCYAPPVGGPGGPPPGGGPPGGPPPGAGGPAGGGPPCWTPPCVPIDGGMGLLIAAGAVFGITRVIRRDKK